MVYTLRRNNTDKIEAVKLLFKLVLVDGEHNYKRLSELTGIPRPSIPVLLTNPVYAGTMVYDTRHDLSKAGEYPMKEGQSRPYRRKIDRTGDEIIRTRMPMDPIITEAQHEYIVDIVEHMRAPRAQARNSNQPRFTYRGFLRCGFCNDRVYTWVSGKKKNGEPKNWYHCKQRSPREQQKRKESGAVLACENTYMMRDRLEDVLDQALTNHLTMPEFLMSTIKAYFAKDTGTNDHHKAIEEQIKRLEQKRKRIIQNFEDGDYGDGDSARAEKNRRVCEVNEQIADLRRRIPTETAAVPDDKAIAAIVTVFREWSFLGMDAKRKLMEQFLPEIFVDRYEVKGVTLRVGVGISSLWSGCDNDNRWKTERSRSRGRK